MRRVWLKYLQLVAAAAAFVFALAAVVRITGPDTLSTLSTTLSSAKAAATCSVPPSSSSSSSDSQSSSASSASSFYPGSEDIHVLVMTGAQTLYERVPLHIASSLSHMPSYAVYSDSPGTIAGTPVYDALANLTDATAKSAGLKVYRRQKHLLSENANVDFTDKRAQIENAWDLDKWKPLPMAIDAYGRVPTAKWYVMMDDDTYIIWPNLIRWLKTIKPTDVLYMGAAAVINGEPFAHGGSGVVYSHALAERAFANNYDLVHKHETFTAENCCGDHIFAHALLGLDIKVNYGSDYPFVKSRLQGEPPAHVRLDRGSWCDEIVSFHRVSPREIENLAEFEKKYDSANTPILYRDVYAHFVMPYVVPHRRWNWDNGADDRMFTSHDPDIDEAAFQSYEDCKARCEAWDECLQFRYRTERCGLGSRLRLGEMVDGDDDNEENSYSSEWMVDRIREMRKTQKCEKVGDWEREEGVFFKGRKSPSIEVSER
ncbi:hypothetical protein BZA70DRAFT_280072 [Myxozyma melibiosi]|uniref:N-acetylgalactosaminide beta-1,3-galactosyltransferase n=1 Tax=Myxozyma melibiosi TaxID=54550 RepID=A0ABR1F4N5_9ASCO